MKTVKASEKFHLSALEKEIYELLLKTGNTLTTKQIALKLRRPVESVSRSITNLRDASFISVSGRHPGLSKALPPEMGINYLMRVLRKSIIGKTVFQPTELKFFTVSGRTAYHQTSERLFKLTGKEVLLIASGTGDLEPEYFKNIVDKVRNGLTFKIISLNLDRSNCEKLNLWKKNGFKVRFKRGRGINLLIFDRKTVQLGLRVFDNTKEKIGLIINNGTFANFLAEFFDFLWIGSEKI